ncbi:Hsp20/alpha crystallin family protein [Clostridium botulinum]|uniref:Hsp20/alpha crystallin family protein n=1 Tax=Clostridium botulinum TaxID=1491 RepID=A0A0M1M0V8_CLOBO|nr:Hsp20 family protein [Clostridium botulinum]KAI3350108.1 Hsp20 family protein [Clostridium botulinum]KOM88928.1 hypothetical protein ACP51_04110 [Clostridium botulinum]KOR63494.1 hypothetical protein ADT22_02895 [Clostridium botulinum]MBN1075840.1 Hsp20/alpha crystallin family protein [Clostridium botulinum]MBN1079108.1 Hsp20/alpha crystallin family protein [Clostridium botulinum]
MFKMFPFKFWGTVNIGNLGNIIGSFLEDIDLSGLIDEFEQEYDEEKFNESQEPEDSKGKDVAEFIQLEEYEEMYILTIELNGVDLRQTSIQYNPGKLSINLNKMEKVSQHIGMFSSDYMVKKNYKKEFDKIESIDESKIMKILENGVLKISMPKKYALNDDSKIVDVKNYIEN